MNLDEKLLDKLKSYTYGLDTGRDHSADAIRYYVNAGTYGIGGVHCIDNEIPNTAAEKKVVTLHARQNLKSVFKVPDDVIEEYDNFANKKLTKNRFIKQLQVCGIQRNEINKILEDVRKWNRPYTLGVAYSYMPLGRYMPQLYCYARTAYVTPEDACNLGLYTIKKVEKGLEFYRKGNKNDRS